MASVEDKTRYYLEQALPDLYELERRKIFSKEEISGIAKKRSSFEFKINGRGSKAADFIRYVEFETNLESLRQKRLSRLGLKGKSHVGERRILLILDRATKKFPGDLDLWMQHAAVARQQRAFRRVSAILASMVRLHPMKPEAWIYAASYAAEEHGDMIEARSYMQRCLRFCKHSEEVWIEYAKLELLYIAKILARRKILGIDQGLRDKTEANAGASEPSTDVISLILPEDSQNSKPLEGGDRPGTRLSEDTPVLSGAIPIAIFDAAMENFQDDELGARFFDLVADFSDLDCATTVQNHIVERMTKSEIPSAAGLDCFIRQPLLGVSSTHPNFPVAIGLSVSRVKSSMSLSTSVQLTRKILSWIVQFLKEELDADVRRVLVAVASRCLRQCQQGLAAKDDALGDEAASIISDIRGMLSNDLEDSFLRWAVDSWPSNRRLRPLTAAVLAQNIIEDAS